MGEEIDISRLAHMTARFVPSKSEALATQFIQDLMRETPTLTAAQIFTLISSGHGVNPKLDTHASGKRAETLKEGSGMKRGRKQHQGPPK